MATVKHSFIKGAKLSTKARAHLNYIQHRPGDDKEKGKEGLGDEDAKTLRRAREEDEDGENGKRGPGRPLRVPGDESQPEGKAAFDFKKAMNDPAQRGRVVHKLILSPPSDRGDVDMNKYTQETMENMGQRKGQELRYAWVVHDNTDNRHAHVVVLGKDMAGQNVRFDKFDHSLMRAYGDQYMSREHSLDFEYNRNPRSFSGLEQKFEHEVEFQARIHGHNLYTSTPEQNAYWLSHPPKRSTWEKDEDFKNLMNLNKNWGESLEGPAREGGLMLGQTWLHDKGRLSEIHDLYSNTRDKDHWEDIQKNSTDQGLKDYAEIHLAGLKEQREATIEDLQKSTGLTPDKFDAFISGIQEQFAVENREIDMALFPEKYEPFDSHERLEGNHFRPVAGPYEHKDIDMDNVKNFDKVELYNGEWISKYDSKIDLSRTLESLATRPHSDWIEKKDYAKVSGWIEKKEEHGDHCYGQPPLITDRDHGPLIEQTTRADDIDVRSIDFDKLSTSASREEKSLQDLVAPRQSESPELTQIEYVSKDSPELSIDEVLDRENPTYDISDNDLSVEDAQTFEESLRDDSFEKSYDIEQPGYELEMLCPQDFDFAEGGLDRQTDGLDERQSDDSHELIESICDIEVNGGEEYDLSDDNRGHEEERTNTDSREEQETPKPRDDDFGR
ncbi:MAG: hypothetical protein K2X81_13350 [Candidatus Obscuribacterales bacterium]|nr:hypothetical protein [Candidatus Obscuribacterales bacterium]